MLNWYHSSLHNKLLVLTAGFLMTLSAVTLWGFRSAWQSAEAFDQINQTSISAERDILLLTIDFKTQVQEWKNLLLRGKDQSALQKHWSAFATMESEIQTRAKQLAARVGNEESRKLLQQFLAAHEKMGEAYRKGMYAFQDAGMDGKAGDAAVQGVDRAPTELLKQAAKVIAGDAEKSIGLALSDGRNAVFSSLLLFAVVLALVMFSLYRFLNRSVVQPLAEAVAAADALAAGDMSREIVVARSDEVGQLLTSMQKVVRVLQGYYAAQAEMKRQHDAGTISYRIRTEAFAGSYGEMAAMTNELVAAHIAVKMRIVEVVSRYAQGDLALNMDKLPGEKAKITEAIDGVKASMQSVNSEISRLVEAALRGDFTVRGDADRYQHDFRKMVEGLNRLMQVSDTGLNEVARVLGALAQGDLTEKITSEYQGTFGKLKDDSNSTVERLTAIVRQIKDSTESINVASKEIASGNADLSSRTEEQASSLEETASSMEELTSTVKQNAENATQANQLAAGAAEVAAKGGEVVGQVVTTMRSIDESSKKIEDIIGVIDGIAFQTNILALNAAVEAARAGEQGRGFAVVASEVRTLAQRSAAAAKEIKDLIEDSVQKVGSGTRLVDEAGQTMHEIVVSVKRVSDIMSEITAASREQSNGIEQVNQAVTQMDEVTQQNAALVEEAAAAAESMEEQAQVLARAVAVFKLDQAAAGEIAASSSAPSIQAERRNWTTRPKNVARIERKMASKPVSRPSIPSRQTAASGAAGEWSEF